jgi:hypothetical protein
MSGGRSKSLISMKATWNCGSHIADRPALSSRQRHTAQRLSNIERDAWPRRKPGDLFTATELNEIRHNGLDDR